MDSELWPFLGRYLQASPVFIVYLIGLLLALARWGRHPSTSLMALLGIGGLFLLQLIMTAVYWWLPRLVERQMELKPYQMSWVYTVLTVIDNLLFAAVWGFVLVAIFGGRQGKPAAPRFEGPMGPGDVGRPRNEDDPDTAYRGGRPG